MTAEAEHGEGDQCVWAGEAEGHAGDESDLGVDGFDEAVGEVVLDRGEDLGAVADDGALQSHELLDPGSSGPADPVVEGVDGLVVGQLEDQPEAFLEEVRPVQGGFGLGDPGEFGVLPGGEVLGVLPQREPGVLQRLGVPGGVVLLAGLASRAQGRGIGAGGVPCFSPDLVQGGGGLVPSAETWVICAQRSGPRASKNAARVALSRPGAAHTSRPVSWSTTTVRYL